MSININNSQIKNIIGFLLVLGLILPGFGFAQETSNIQPPETLEEAKQMGKKALEVTKKELPGILEKIWKEEVLPLWQRMYDWFKENIWSRIVPRAKEEIEKRKSVIEKEFKKEKEELKQEVPKVGKSLWERFKELINR